MADSTDQMAHGIWLLLFLLLVGSSLISRRLPMARLLAWSAGWVVAADAYCVAAIAPWWRCGHCSATQRVASGFRIERIGHRTGWNR